MDIVTIKGKDKFTLSSVVYTSDAKGEQRVCCNYSMLTGPKGSLKITFEGYAIKDVVRIKKEYPFKSLLKMFDDRRIYLQGVHYLDGQFEKHIDTENKEC